MLALSTFFLARAATVNCDATVATCGNAIREIPKQLPCKGFVAVHGCTGLLKSVKKSANRGCDDDIEAGVAGYCLCKGKCDDVPNYKDQGGFECSHWQGYDCRRIVRDYGSRYGYMQRHQDEIIENCAASCNICEGVKIRHESCDHGTFKCANECRRADNFGCVKFRATLGCSPEGELDPESDKACSSYIEDKSGYCECTGGRSIKVDTCKRPGIFKPFTCAAMCRKGSSVYELLGVGMFSAENEYKKAFRGMSLRYHPDKTINKPEEQAKFEAIRHAYDVVQDSMLKEAYDFGGWDLLKRTSNNYNKPDSTEDIEINIRIPLNTLYTGGDVNPNFKRLLVCQGCQHESTSRCRKCKDSCLEIKKFQNIQRGNMIYRQEYTEPSLDKCRKEVLDAPIHVEKGANNGHQVYLKGKAHQVSGQIAGDLIFKLEVEGHPVFKRMANNLIATIEISLKEALTGLKKTLTHLDGHTVSFEVGPVQAAFSRIRIIGEGMPILGSVGHGDLVVNLKVNFPRAPLNEEQQEWIRQNLPDN
eukprot:GEMP01009830.1.p1 GENE.GEMP01009830.1~~GEMP01009830.1.p1  ORF type:complete len:546 (+),score=84.90 GEMP01009830.1:44-1639(+)